MTKPLTVSGNTLELNYSTSAAGSIQVTIVAATSRDVLAKSKRLIGDEIDGVVTWENGDSASLAGKPVRLRFVMKDADLYSFRFSKENHGEHTGGDSP